MFLHLQRRAECVVGVEQFVMFLGKREPEVAKYGAILHLEFRLVLFVRAQDGDGFGAEVNRPRLPFFGGPKWTLPSDLNFAEISWRMTVSFAPSKSIYPHLTPQSSPMRVPLSANTGCWPLLLPRSRSPSADFARDDNRKRTLIQTFCADVGIHRQTFHRLTRTYREFSKTRHTSVAGLISVLSFKHFEVAARLAADDPAAAIREDDGEPNPSVAS